MRARPAARLLVLNPANHVLLFKFVFETGPLIGTQFWATPGGALDPGETYEQAAIRELFEETGLVITDPGLQVAQIQTSFRAPDGDQVSADERFFLIRVGDVSLSNAAWTALEREVVKDQRWWSTADIRASDEQIWPVGLADLVERLTS